MAFNPMALLSGARALDRLFQLEKKHGAILEAQADEIQRIKDRLTKLEAREEILIAEAKGAAAAVASATASQHVADIARRLGAMEERLRGSGSARLPPPDDGC